MAAKVCNEKTACRNSFGFFLASKDDRWYCNSCQQ
ncbi:hypothetical protein [Nitratiruptor tergarcus]